MIQPFPGAYVYRGIKIFSKKVLTLLSRYDILIKHLRDAINVLAVGVYYDEGPPVPIPNTVVKLIRAEDTWREAARENRSAPTLANSHPCGWLFLFCSHFLFLPNRLFFDIMIEGLLPLMR